MHYKDEIDFKDLLKSPSRLFGLSYLYFLFLGGGLGAYYIWNMNVISRNETSPVILKDSSAFVLEIPMVRGSVIPPVDVTKVGKPSKELIDRGAALYKANCSSCHGDNGMGDGMTAGTLTVKPRNFHTLDGWKNGRKISNMYKTLQEGIVASGMPSFSYISAEERFAMIHFIRTFVPTFPLDSMSELMDLEKQYALSKGSLVAPQIPVGLAVKLITKENDAEIQNTEKQTVTLQTSGQSEYALLQYVCTDTKRVLTVASKIASGKSLDDFIKIVSSDPVTLGFNANILRLSAGEWSELYSIVLKSTRSANG